MYQVLVADFVFPHASHARNQSRMPSKNVEEVNTSIPSSPLGGILRRALLTFSANQLASCLDTLKHASGSLAAPTWRTTNRGHTAPAVLSGVSRRPM